MKTRRETGQTGFTFRFNHTELSLRHNCKTKTHRNAWASAFRAVAERPNDGSRGLAAKALEMP